MYARVSRPLERAPIQGSGYARLACGIISKVARETVAWCFVFVCTLLHHELRDYSLG